MALSGKVETQVEIQAPAAKFYYVFRKQLHHVPNGAKVHDADWENVGSVKHWDFTIESMREPDTYSVERKLRVLVGRSCYSDIIAFADNYHIGVLSSSTVVLREKNSPFHEAKEAQFRPQNTPKFKMNSTKHVITSWGTKPFNQFQESMQESRIPKFLVRDQMVPACHRARRLWMRKGAEDDVSLCVPSDTTVSDLRRSVRNDHNLSPYVIGPAASG
ncbi:hypothetical protein JHK85_019274 [Glycine max]|nr:hypothetical protein JHK85_019274 [Glycine max]